MHTSLFSHLLTLKAFSIHLQMHFLRLLMMEITRLCHPGVLSAMAFVSQQWPNPQSLMWPALLPFSSLELIVI